VAASLKNKENCCMKTVKKKLFTIKEAAKLIDGLSEYRIRQMCRTGQLPSFKAGNKTLIYEENLYKSVIAVEWSEQK
jgi:hypothetical protein